MSAILRPRVVVPAMPPAPAARVHEQRAQNLLKQAASFGQRASAYLAREAAPPDSWGGIRDWYMTRFPRQSCLPMPLDEQLRWAESHWELFQPLLQHGVLPLDVMHAGTWCTVVEFFRDWLAWDAISSARRQAVYAEESAYVIHNNSGAIGSRGLPQLMRVMARERPELLPVARFSRGRAYVAKGRDMRIRAVYEQERMTKPPVASSAPRLMRPGFFCNARVSRVSAARGVDYWRLLWQWFDTPIALLEHLLRGGETCNMVRVHPHGSLYECIRQVEDWSLERLRTAILWSTEQSKESPPDDKFFICVTNRPQASMGLDTGNVRIHVRTNRAFHAQLNMNSFKEGEYGIPFVINPAEIVAAEYNYVDSAQRTVLDFQWADDYRRLTVVATGGAWDGQRYQYAFDPVARTMHLRTF